METNRGLVKNIVLIIVALAALKYFFNWSIFDAIESEQGKETISYIRMVLNTLWSYLEAPVNYIWKEVILPIINEIISKAS